MKETEKNREIDCCGQYGEFDFCSECSLKEQCKKFTKAEQEVSIRYKGKYKGRGKEKKGDKY